MMTSTTTKPTEREQWRARILQALAELDATPPGLDRAAVPPKDDGATASSDR
ncbi:MAG: hypothetical protein KF764_08200 [Labilithrix sp.]|nr:hypothetical protein [Labilithrix sp.]MBX3221137.1 hypothetical protein [Labilithrix sp.]